MPSRFYHLAIDCRDPRALARFWAAALGQQVLAEDDEEAIVGADPHSYPGLCFLACASWPCLTARRSRTGCTWVVLADPEGNEFCVLRPHRSVIG